MEIVVDEDVVSAPVKFRRKRSGCIVSAKLEKLIKPEKDMNPKIAKRFGDQLLEILREGNGLRYGGQHDDLSDRDESAIYKVLTQGRAAVERIAGDASPYAKSIRKILDSSDFPGNHLIKVLGVLDALHSDICAGHLDSLSELIHAELFSDFLEMADHLLAEGYKDPAAVIAGAALEEHLRQLCKKSGVDVETQGKSGMHAKKADQLNSDLVGAAIYSKLDQKSVTAWLGLRNNAAHGKFGEYTKEQVMLMVSGIQDFIIRNPA